MNSESKSKEFFESELENILFIHFDAKYYFKDIEYINKPETNEELIASNNTFIKRLEKAFWRLGIIEIAKLFQKSRNQHFNLIDYLEELINNYEEYTWIQNLSKNKLHEWLTSINSKEIKTIRDKINIQRNNYFAHTDKKPVLELNKAQLTFNDINQLIKITEEIIFELKLNCLKTHSDLEISGLEKAGDILEAYIALKEKREMKIKEEWEEFLNERKKFKKNGTQPQI